jgi:pyrroline-5-carboxylate reductase
MQNHTTQPTIAFIGGGNMASALAGGLIADRYPPGNVRVAEPDADKRARLSSRLGVECSADAVQAARGAAILVLAVKPQVIEGVARALAGVIRETHPLVISVAAGIREQDLADWLGGGVSLVRTMPNTPAMIQAGATVLHAGPGVSRAQRDQAESILRSVGLTLWVDDEDQLDAVTALSGSGPAYFFLVMEALEAVAAQLGLPAETARLLTLQTALGAAKMALESQEPPADLRRRVTSPGGTTEQAVRVLEDGGLRSLFEQALTAARDRSIELSKRLGGH